MFVRKKKNKSGSVSIQIIKKIGRKNRVIKSIGSSMDPHEINRLYHKALHELPRLFGPTLFDEIVEPSFEDLSNDDIRVVGPQLVFGKIFDHIGFNAINDSLFKDLCISRITHPGSKLQLSKYLQENNREEVSADRIYYFMDRLNSTYKIDIEEISFRYTKKILGGDIGVVFYDMTTIYFESDRGDEFRETGFSKEGKHQHPQIYLGLLVGKNGYPIGYDIFEGGIYEGHTLIPVLERLEKRFELQKPIIVADAGLLSSDNILALKGKGYRFILGARIKNESKKIKTYIHQLSFTDGHIERIVKEDDTILYISYSDQRAKKDKFNREKGLKRLEKSIKSGRLTKSSINNRGYNKYLKLEGEVTIQIDYSKFKDDQIWDGLKGYLTNTNLTDEEVVNNYNNLWHIEKAFRVSKTDLKIRPIYHRLKERIEAHICISFISYLLFKELERVLGNSNTHISINQAIKHINKMHEIIIQHPNGYRQQTLLKNNPIQEHIIKLINSNF
jgi:transposase